MFFWGDSTSAAVFGFPDNVDNAGHFSMRLVIVTDVFIEVLFRSYLGMKNSIFSFILM
jgi:hypothetical protein